MTAYTETSGGNLNDIVARPGFVYFGELPSRSWQLTPEFDQTRSSALRLASSFAGRGRKGVLAARLSPERQ
jgi:hypothetical protein